MLGALTRYEVIPTKGGNNRKSIPGVSRFRTDEPEGEYFLFAMLEMLADERVAYSNLSRRSEQLSCRKYFHLSYGLKDMIYKRI